MTKCSRCGSHAINPHCHDRNPELYLDLCDVCYWRKCAEDAQNTIIRITNVAHADRLEHIDELDALCVIRHLTRKYWKPPVLKGS